ncbi:MAG: 6-phosphogluconolactonase [Bacteroidales bacterium]|jgi:6-phosphogluconolactonase
MKEATHLTEYLIKCITDKLYRESSQESRFFLAISGGSSPENLFRLWRGDFIGKIPWGNIELFWVDERCVTPHDSESNFGQAKRQLLDFLPIPENNVHRIHGEEDPETEAERYSMLVMKILPITNGVPIFDFIILGVGEDGHTSSIFPGQDHLYDLKYPYSKSINPNSGQKRVSMTGLPITRAEMTAFYITGENKTAIMNDIYKSERDTTYPAGYMLKHAKNSKVFWDK